VEANTQQLEERIVEAEKKVKLMVACKEIALGKEYGTKLPPLLNETRTVNQELFHRQVVAVHENNRGDKAIARTSTEMKTESQGIPRELVIPLFFMWGLFISTG
jgi:hypothetical protein